MDSGVIELFGTRYYTHFFGIVLIAPFALWCSISVLPVLMRKISGKPVKWYGAAASIVSTLLMFIAVFGDVYLIGRQATKLCNENAGLYVYRTVEAESFLGAAGIKNWIGYGFKFTEGGGDDRKIRYFYENGKPTFKEIDKFLSRYELVITREKLFPKIARHQYQVIDRHSNELLGEVIQFTIDGGWADEAFYGITGMRRNPWKCRGESIGDSSPINIVTHVIKPIRK